MDRRGFTLLEMVVTMLIAGMLAGIGVASYQSVRQHVDEASARQAARAVVLAEQRLWQRQGAFSEDPTELEALEGAYSYVDGTTPSTHDTQVSVALGLADGLDAVGIAVSQQGRCVVVVVVGPGEPVPYTGSWGADRQWSCTGNQAFNHYGVGEWEL